MTEEKEKTAEEKLIESAKAGEGSSATAKTDGGATEADKDENPEQKLIKELREKAEEAERRAKKAEDERDIERSQKDSARKEASNAAEKQIKTQEEVIASNLTAAQSTFKAARQKWRDAKDSGDSEKEEEALVEFNDAQMKLRSAEYNSNRFKDWKEARKVTSDSDGLLDLKTGAGDVLRVPQSAIEWSKRHPKFTDDPTYTYAVYGGDTKAKAAGIEVYSREYYDFLDKHLESLGLESRVEKTDEKESGESKKAESEKGEKTSSKKSDKQTTAAPPGGSTGSTSSDSKKQTFTMTPEMRRAAQFTFPDDYKKDPKMAEEKYAKYQLEIQAKKARGEL